MSFWKSLFGGSADPAPEPIEHDGFKITPTPIREGNTYRVSALIEKEIGGQMQRHEMIRADTVEALEAAEEVSLRKAKQTIDQLGDGIFK